MQFTKEELENEEWLDVLGYEGLYQISDLGRVKSLGNNATKKEKMLVLCPNKTGYIVVQLSRNGKPKPHYVHRLVAINFIPNPENKPEVNHIDKDKRNNRKINVEWNTKIENIFHSLPDERTSIYVGVTLDSRRVVHRWRASISIKGNRLSLGSFDTELEAALSRTKYEIDNLLIISNPSVLLII